MIKKQSSGKVEQKIIYPTRPPLSPMKKFMDRNQPGVDQRVNAIQLKSEIEARLIAIKDSTNPEHLKEMEQLTQLKDFTEKVVISAFIKQDSTTETLKIIMRDINTGLDKMDDVKDQQVRDETGKLKKMLREMNSFIEAPGEYADAVQYGAFLRPIFEQQAAVDSIYVDTFENYWIRNPPEQAQVKRLKDNLIGLRKLDTANQQTYDQYIKAVDQYCAAYAEVGGMFKSVYDGTGPYELKDSIQLTEQQLKKLDDLNRMHSEVSTILNRLQVKKTDYSHLISRHIELFKQRVTTREEEVGRIRERSTGQVEQRAIGAKGQYQSLPIFSESSQYVGARTKPDQYQGVSLIQSYKEAIGGKQWKPVSDQQKVDDLVANIDQLATQDNEHEQQWNSLRYCITTLNEKLGEAGAVSEDFYPQNDQRVESRELDKKGWIEWMDGWQKHLEDTLGIIDMKNTDPSSPLALHYQLVKDILQDKRDAIAHLEASAA